MNAIELDAIAHDGKVVINLPEVYREQWNDKAVRVIVLSVDKPTIRPKTSLLASLRQIKVSGSADFSENLDAYLSGERWEEDLRGF